MNEWSSSAAAAAAATPELSILAVLLLAAIGFYQRRLSPHKGFCCAWRYRTGRASCSEYARRIVNRCGALALFDALPRQLGRCRSAFSALRAQPASKDQKEDAARRRHERARDACDACGNGSPGECPDARACDAGGCDLPLDCSL